MKQAWKIKDTWNPKANSLLSWKKRKTDILVSIEHCSKTTKSLCLEVRHLRPEYIHDEELLQ